MKYLRTKLRRDLMRLFPQFISVFVMALLSVTIFSGFENVWTGMDHQAKNFYKQGHLCDAWIYGKSLDNKSLKKIRDLKGVTKATHSMSILTDLDDDEKDENHSDIQLTTISSTANQKPVSVKGKAYDKKAYGIWLDKTFADKHNLKVGDKIKISYGKLPEATVKIKGLVMSPEYIHYTAIATQTMPDYQKHGYGYVSEKQMEKITGMIYYNQIRINTTKNCNLDKLEEKAEDVLGDKFYSLQTHDDNKSTFQMKDEIDQTKRMATMFTFVFILLALLTMYTTMSRLVKNQMIQIGTMKAIGMTNGEIRTHYMMYGLLVPLIGALIGIPLGKITVARVVMMVKQTTLTLPEWSLETSWGTVMVIVLIIVICVFATMWAAGKALKLSPAETMRGIENQKKRKLKAAKKSAPKSSGNYVWTWVKRDTARNKLRYLIGVIGVTGSMMLMIAGFGMYDSIDASNNYIFNEQYSYDYTGELKEANTALVKQVNDEIKNHKHQWMWQNSVDIKYGDDQKESTIITVLDKGDLFKLEDESTGKRITLPDHGIVVTNKLASDLGIRKGDRIRFNVTGVSKDFKEKVVKITSVRMPQGIYLSKKSWKNMGEKYVPLTIMMNKDGHKAIKDSDAIREFTTIRVQKSNINDLSESCYTVIKLLIIASFFLSIVILYNLGMMNYDERYREYATMKVMGYTSNEIRSIVMTDCMLVSIPGWLIGIPVGFAFLKAFINVVSFDSLEWRMTLEPIHFILLSVFVILCAVLINLFICHKVNKIVMTEALKSVD